MSQMKKLNGTNTEFPSIDELLLLSVKISKKDSDGHLTLLGTGTIAYDGVDYYVLTAAHCFRDEKGNDDCELEDIVITLSEEGGNPQKIHPKSWVKSDVETDAALIQIDNPNINFDFHNGLKLLGKEFGAKACVFGYTEGVKEGRLSNLNVKVFGDGVAKKVLLLMEAICMIQSKDYLEEDFSRKPMG